MTRLRSSAASAGQARLLSSGFTAVLLTIGASSRVFACPQCFGAEETTLVAGTKLGIIVLLAVILVVEGLFVAFFVHLRRRAKRLADADQTGGLRTTDYGLRQA